MDGRLVGSTNKMFGRIRLHIKVFGLNDSGIATIEWVALAGGIVIASIAISYVIMAALGETAVGIASQLSP